MTNRQFDEVENHIRLKLKADECPTCHSVPFEDKEGYRNRDNGTYILHGEPHECDCETQINLYRHYTLAGIGEQYMRLPWSEYTGSQEAIDTVSIFLDKWQNFKQHGMGIEFSSPSLGVGKTFAASHLGMELVKRSERVLFVSFEELIAGYTREDEEEFDDLLRSITWLILDEVLPPSSESQGALFSRRFESVIRHRQNHNMPVIMTTNLTPKDFEKSYARTYSLLSAKQHRVEMSGPDFRSTLNSENLELMINDEVRPIV